MPKDPKPIENMDQHKPLPTPPGEGKGDARTPDQPIGEVAYADREPEKKKTAEF